MKITEILIRKEPMEGGELGLAFRCTLENGEQIGCTHPWRNTLGVWASDSNAREPAEIAAVLHGIAKGIEDWASGKKAA